VSAVADGADTSMHQKLLTYQTHYFLRITDAADKGMLQHLLMQ
jgi:hypothetical protein